MLKNYREFVESVYKNFVSFLYFLIKYLPAIFGILTIGFGTTGFLINGESVSVSILNAIMMFGLEYPTDPNILNWALYLSIAFAILTLFSAVVLIFLKKRVEWYLLQISLKREHILVFGLGEAVTSFLDGYVKENRKEHIVIIEADPNNKKLEEYRKRGFGIYIGDSLSDKTFELFNLKTMKYAIIAMGTDKINIELAKKIINAYKEKKEETPISLIIHIQNRDLDILFHQDFILPNQGLNKASEAETAESDNKQKIEIKTFSFFNEAAEELFENHFIDGDSDEYIKSDKGFHSILIGNGELMKSVIYQMALLSHLPNENIHTVHIVDKHAEEVLAKTEKYLHYRIKPDGTSPDNFPSFKIEPVPIDRDSLAYFEDPIWHKEDLVNVIIAYDDEHENMNLAIELFNRTYLARAKGKQPMPKIIFANYDHFLLNDIIDENEDDFNHFYTFGNSNKVLSPTNLLEEEKDQIAKLINAGYGDKYEPEHLGIDQKKIDKEWYNYNSYNNKLSNRSQAKQIDMKLKAMGYSKTKSSMDKKELLAHNRKMLGKVFDEERKALGMDDEKLKEYSKELKKYRDKDFNVKYFPQNYTTLFEKMIRREHNRWNAFHFLNGWKYAEVENKEIREHNCLLPMEKFENDKIKITAIYDIYSFLYIPNYLAEAGYIIIPLEMMFAIKKRKMANLLSHTTRNISYSISNSWTTVLYSTLLISGSHLAETRWEKSFMMWLAEHDQNHVGLGMVGIDFDNIYWLTSDFEKQKEFVIKIAKNAIDKKSWTKLDYETNEETLTGLLNLWIALFSKARIEDIKPKDDFNWYNKPDLSKKDMKCHNHHVFLNQLGNTEKECCYLCNNQ